MYSNTFLNILYSNIAGRCQVPQLGCESQLCHLVQHDLPDTHQVLSMPAQSPELMKEAIMPLSLTRASCSSSIVMFSESFGSAVLGMPREMASCRQTRSRQYKRSWRSQNHTYVLALLFLQEHFMLEKPHLCHLSVRKQPSLLHSVRETFPAPEEDQRSEWPSIAVLASSRAGRTFLSERKHPAEDILSQAP